MVSDLPHSRLFEQSGSAGAEVTVCVSLYNYADFILEALESVVAQTTGTLDLIVVDDCSRDQSLALAGSWFERNSERFNTALLVGHTRNSGGPSGPRNTAISLSRTPYVFMLDADNILYPRCVARCLEALKASDASVAYPLIEKFGAETGILGNQLWDRGAMALGNYIDTMSLIRTSCLEAVRGYSTLSICGWEDYDLWCKFVEHTYYGILVPEILARYRVHRGSMTVQTTKQNLKMAVDDMMQRHPWLKLQLP